MADEWLTWNEWKPLKQERGISLIKFAIPNKPVYQTQVLNGR